jgi:glycosyltransferase involved in cell wall biosynthesis
MSDPAMTYDLVFFPDYRAANPYQRLLYDRLAPLHPRAGTIDDALRVLDHASPQQRVIFHLHWEDALHRHVSDPDSAARAVQGFLVKLEDFVERGGTLVWTVHNHRSHIAVHPETDRSLRAALARMADRIHVHSMAALRDLSSELDIPLGKAIVLPHGNYRPIHDPCANDRLRARAGRGWRDDDITLLLFGRLDAYKGGTDLLAAFATAPSRLRLVIAGKQIEPLDRQIAQMAPEVRARITLLGTFVPEAEVGDLVIAADALVLPYRTIMTSGTLMLALSLGRPVIAPDLPAITDVVSDGNEALIYPHAAEDGLRLALERLAALDQGARDRMARQALATGAFYDWAWIGRQLGDALVGATGHGRANRLPLRVSALAAIPG